MDSSALVQVVLVAACFRTWHNLAADSQLREAQLERAQALLSSTKRWRCLHAWRQLVLQHLEWRDRSVSVAAALHFSGKLHAGAQLGMEQCA